MFRSLTKTQLVVIVCGLSWLIPSLGTWLLFPKYLVEGNWRHAFVFDPPTAQVGNRIDQLSPEDLKRLWKDPRQAEAILAMRGMPDEIELKPSWIGSKHNGSRNLLFANLVLACVAFFAGLKWTGIL